MEFINIINAINTGLSSKYILAIRIILFIISFIFILSAISSYNKKRKLKFTIDCIFTVILLSVSFFFIFTKLTSKEEQLSFTKKKEITFQRGEIIISSIEIYYKRYNKYPKKLKQLYYINQHLKTLDGWGFPYNYSNEGPSYRLSFRIPGKKGYYFYNSGSGTNRLSGYLFKYMGSNVIN